MSSIEDVRIKSMIWKLSIAYKESHDPNSEYVDCPPNQTALENLQLIVKMLSKYSKLDELIWFFEPFAEAISLALRDRTVQSVQSEILSCNSGDIFLTLSGPGEHTTSQPGHVGIYSMTEHDLKSMLDNALLWVS
jgi:hypothetical protein